MASSFLLIDNGVLQTLWEVGGVDALEHLFDRGLQVVIPKDVIFEIDTYPGSQALRGWVEGNDRIIKPNYLDPAADAARIAFDLARVAMPVHAVNKDQGVLRRVA